MKLRTQETILKHDDYINPVRRYVNGDDIRWQLLKEVVVQPHWETLGEEASAKLEREYRELMHNMIR